MASDSNPATHRHIDQVPRKTVDEYRGASFNYDLIESNSESIPLDSTKIMEFDSNPATQRLIDPKSDKTVDVRTGGSCSYDFVKSNSESIRLTITATNDAYIALTYNAYLHPPMYIIKLGIDNNTRSAICKDEKEVVSTKSAQALLGESVDYWIRWYHATIAVGRENETKPFISFVDEELVPIRYVGLSTKHGTRGDWSIRFSPKISPAWYPGGNWVYGCDGWIPPEAVVGGHEDGRKCYITRVLNYLGVIPGKLIEGDRLAFYSEYKREASRQIYEILCNYEGRWVSAENGHIPRNAIVGGRYYTGAELFLARAQYGKDLITGYVSGREEECTISYWAYTKKIKKYEVLTMTS